MDVVSDRNFDRWLSVEEIASYLGISKESVYRWAEQGKMPAHKVGRQWKFWANEVNEWVRKGEAKEEHLARKIK